jgi:hypothetical protein
MPLLTEKIIATNVHVLRAVDELIARMLTAQDTSGKAFLLSGVLSSTTKENIAIGNTPLLLVRIVDPAPGQITTQNMTISRVSQIVELVATVIFGVPGRTDDNAQRVGAGIEDSIWRTIEPFRDANSVAPNLNGWKREPPIFWDFSTDTNFKAKLLRGVTLWEEKSSLAEQLLAVSLQFKINVYPQRPLPPLPS